MKYSLELHKSLYSEARESWVWLPKKVEGNVKSGDMIKVSHNNNSIILEARIVDKHYESRLKKSPTKIDNSLFLNQNYRTKLGLTTDDIGKEKEFDIEKTVNPYNHYIKYFIQHPRAEVRLTCYLALASILISLLPTMKNLFLWFLKHVCNCI